MTNSVASEFVCRFMHMERLWGKVNCFAQSSCKWFSPSGVLCYMLAQTTNAFDAPCVFVKKDKFFEHVCDTSNWWRKLFVGVFAITNWHCVASQFCLVLCACTVCGAKSILLRKAGINDFLRQGSCVTYLLKQRTLSMHHVYLLKRQVFWACMWH